MAIAVRHGQNQPATLREAMDRFMESTFNGPWWAPFWAETNATGALNFPVNVYQNADSYLVTAALPGINPDQVQITALNGTLTISGETGAPGIEGYEPIYTESQFGQFRRDIRLPGDFAVENAEAVYENGMLRLTLPKAEHLKPKSLRVKVVKG
ncbi:MAG TPA: Hsp20/alpha crystallin family protein [Chloroflexota bacterium]|nr:Hsp20/alpha crystallin family protein [Chloroflexota bacterium]